MNRNEEYQALLAELEPTPPALEYAVQRARTRRARRRRWFGVSAASLAGCFTAFVLLVNLMPAFAYACGRVPGLRQLAKAVAWSPSLSAAVEHEYVQPVEQEQTADGVTARVEYVIVDLKQVTVFYSLNSEQYQHMNAEPRIRGLNGAPLESYSVGMNAWDIPNGELCSFTVDFMESDMPDGLQATLNITNYDPECSTEVVESDILTEPEPGQPDYVASFTFDLRFSAYYTEQGTTVAVGQTFTLDGQTLTLRDAEIYPSHIRLNFDDAPENTAWLVGMKFYLTNEGGRTFDTIANGIIATGSPDSPMMNSYRCDSDFFVKSRQLTLHITQAQWLDKNRQRIRLDLADCTAEFLPEGVSFVSSERKTNGWVLTFWGRQFEKNASYQLWNHDYYDAAGNAYEFNSWGSGGLPQIDAHDPVEGAFSVEIPLVDYTEDTVWMSPSFTRITTFENPVSVTVQ